MEPRFGPDKVKVPASGPLLSVGQKPPFSKVRATALALKNVN
jgi:hypothetical protein